MEFKVSVTAVLVESGENEAIYKIKLQTHEHDTSYFGSYQFSDKAIIEEERTIKFNRFDREDNSCLLGQFTIYALHMLGYIDLDDSVQQHLNFLEQLGCKLPHFYDEQEIERLDAEDSYNNDLWRGEL